MKPCVYEPLTLKDRFEIWCKLTKRSGGVLIGPSLREFLDWVEIQERPKVVYEAVYIWLPGRYDSISFHQTREGAEKAIQDHKDNHQKKGSFGEWTVVERKVI